MDDISKAIKERDFESFAKITMMDSNNFHACCLDTSPPIFYLNDVSKAIIAVVEEINRASLAAGNGLIAGYTFDAGPNAVIYALEKNMPTIISTVNKFFPQEAEFSDPFGTFAGKSIEEVALLEGFDAGVVKVGGWEKGAVKSLIHTKVGDGPRRLGKEDSLLNEQGVPKTLA
jgi:diphosphomevalonate decarboxylase